MTKKKGIEPLIATILLIVVAVILVTIVLTWGKSFTNKGLDTANQALEETCKGAMLSISNCRVTTDGNVVFQLTNIGNYAFPDVPNSIKVLISSNYGSESAEHDLVFLQPPTWAGLTPGQSVIATYKPAPADANTLKSDISANVLVRSTVCPQVSTSYSNCRR